MEREEVRCDGLAEPATEDGLDSFVLLGGGSGRPALGIEAVCWFTYELRSMFRTIWRSAPAGTFTVSCSGAMGAIVSIDCAGL